MKRTDKLTKVEAISLIVFMGLTCWYFGFSMGISYGRKNPDLLAVINHPVVRNHLDLCQDSDRWMWMSARYYKYDRRWFCEVYETEALAQKRNRETTDGLEAYVVITHKVVFPVCLPRIEE